MRKKPKTNSLVPSKLSGKYGRCRQIYNIFRYIVYSTKTSIGSNIISSVLNNSDLFTRWNFGYFFFINFLKICWMSAITFRVLSSTKWITKLYAYQIHSIGRDQTLFLPDCTVLYGRFSSSFTSRTNKKITKHIFFLHRICMETIFIRAGSRINVFAINV